MIRIIVVNLLLLLLPTIIYFTYIYLRRQQTPDSQDSEILADAPIFWLLAGGAALSIIVLVFLVQWEGSQLNGRYIPPRLEDGVVIPGHVEPIEKPNG
jgi:hypothetical protein